MSIGRILVIEDEPSWQKTLERALKGYDIHKTVDAEEAKKALDQALVENNPFQVVTLDIRLKPGEQGQSDKSGEEILGYIKQEHRYIKCIVVSGTADVDQVSNYHRQFAILKVFSKGKFNSEDFRRFVDSIFYVGKYRKIKELGRGGMGVIYYAEDTETGRKVALKVLKIPDLLDRLIDGRIIRRSESDILDRFRQEAKAIQSMKHDHIVSVYEYVVTEVSKEASYIVMEYLEGPTLVQILEQKGRLPVEQVIEIGVQLCDALTYIHQQHIVHRDINPSNLIFAGDGQLKVTDFGIAKVLDSNEHLTLTLEVFGSPRYMPPEQLRSAKQVDHRADIYAAGAVLYKALTGKLPYEAELFSLRPAAFSEYGLTVPGNLEEIILCMLANDPKDRPQSAEVVRQILEDLSKTGN